MKAVLVILAAYLLGSIPFGYLIVRMKLGADIRETGSGGTGATNVSRRAGKLAGVLTLALDVLKGAAAILLAQRLLNSSPGAAWWVAVAAIAVLLGHIFPVWLRFRGGKGVATGVGVFLVFTPIAVAVALIVFLLTVWATRYVSLGSLLAAATVPLLVLLQYKWFILDAALAPLMFAAISAALLIIFAHRANIERLARGTENKFGES